MPPPVANALTQILSPLSASNSYQPPAQSSVGTKLNSLFSQADKEGKLIAGGLIILGLIIFIVQALK